MMCLWESLGQLEEIKTGRHCILTSFFEDKLKQWFFFSVHFLSYSSTDIKHYYISAGSALNHAALGGRYAATALHGAPVCSAEVPIALQNDLHTDERFPEQRSEESSPDRDITPLGIRRRIPPWRAEPSRAVPLIYMEREMEIHPAPFFSLSSN